MLLGGSRATCEDNCTWLGIAKEWYPRMLCSLQGSEFLPVLSRGSDRDTGYSRVNERILNPRVSDRGPAGKNGNERAEYLERWMKGVSDGV